MGIFRLQAGDLRLPARGRRSRRRAVSAPSRRPAAAGIPARWILGLHGHFQGQEGVRRDVYAGRNALATLAPRSWRLRLYSRGLPNHLPRVKRPRQSRCCTRRREYASVQGAHLPVNQWRDLWEGKRQCLRLTLRLHSNSSNATYRFRTPQVAVPFENLILENLLVPPGVPGQLREQAVILVAIIVTVGEDQVRHEIPLESFKGSLPARPAREGMHPLNPCTLNLNLACTVCKMAG